MRGTLAALTLLLLVGVLAWRPITDDDFALHMAGGRWIAEHAAVPDLDPFTYTASDRDYLAYHWLFQLALYGIERASGDVGLALARWLCVLATALLVLDVFRRRRVSALAGSLVGFAVILATEFRLALRPELLTYLLGASTLWVLEEDRNGRSSRLWLLPLVQLVWVNTHLFAIGWILMLIYLGDAIGRRRGIRPLAGWVGAALVASFANPYHYHAVLYPIYLATRLRGSNAFASGIVELWSPFAAATDARFGFGMGPQLEAYCVLLALGSIALILQLRRRRWIDAAMLGVFGALSLGALRNIGLYAVLCAPALGSALDDLGAAAARRWPSAARRAAAVVLSLTLALVLLTSVRVVRGSFYRDALRPERFAAGLCEQCLAIPAADWIAQGSLVGPGFNNFNIGSVLAWRDPARKVFIDGRNEVTGEALFEDYLGMLDPAGWERGARRYGFEYAVLRYNADVQALALARYLDGSPAWRLVYADGSAVVFARVDGPNGGMPAASLPPAIDAATRRRRLESIRVEGGAWAGLRRWLWSREPSPGAEFELGTALLVLGRLQQAEAPLLAAALASPGAFEVHNNLGELYWRGRAAKPALIAYRNALALEPDHREIQQRVLALERGVASRSAATIAR